MSTVPEKILEASAKSLAEKQGFRWAGLSLADKKFYREQAQGCIETYILHSYIQVMDDLLGPSINLEKPPIGVVVVTSTLVIQ